MNQMTFDLLNQPWVKVRMLDGCVTEVSLRDVFHKAHEISDLAGESATQDSAVLRMLLAVVIRSVRLTDMVEQPAVDTWDELRNMPDFGDLVGSYLDTVHDRFDLFHTTHPFFQVADLQTTKGEYDSAATLIPDVGPHLFSTRTEKGAQSLSAAEAARWVIHHQAYSPSGIKSGAVGDQRVKGGKGYPIGTGWVGALGSVFIVGPTLKDTLLLSIPLDAFEPEPIDIEKDVPPWERTPDTAAPRGLEEVDPRGVVDILTWQQRRIRLWPDEQGQVRQALVCNGDKIRVANQFIEPLSSFRFSATQSKNGNTVYFAKGHDPELTVWRGIQALFLESGSSNSDASQPQDRPAQVIDQLRTNPVFDEAVKNAYGSVPLGLALVGVEYGTQNAVVEQEITETLHLYPAILGHKGQQLRQQALDAVSMVMSFRGSMKWFMKQLLVCSGGSSENELSHSAGAWLVQMEAIFVQWLAGLDQDTDPVEAGRQWRKEMHLLTLKHIEKAVEDAGPQAAIGIIKIGENGRGDLHSSARYESWARKKLTELTGVKSMALSQKGEVRG